MVTQMDKVGGEVGEVRQSQEVANEATVRQTLQGATLRI